MARVIVVLHPSDELYGADRVLLSVIDRLRQRDDVQVWLPTDVDYPDRALSRELQTKGVDLRRTELPVLRRAYRNPRDLAAIAGRARRLFSELRVARPAGVYVNTSALAPAVPIASALGVPTTLHIHETWGATERRVLTGMCSPADVVIAVGEATRRSLPERLRRRAMISRHAVDPQPADPEQVRRIRALAGPDDILVLFAGRWTPGKGVAELLAAFAETGDPRLRLLMLGAPPPSGAAVDPSSLIEELSLQDRVHLIGEVQDVWPYLYASDAVVVPSVKPESYPTIALEAIAAGKPVLASDIGGLPEIVTPGRGQLLRPGDITIWARALASLPQTPRSATMRQ